MCRVRAPLRRDHIHHYTTCLSSTDLPGGRSTEDPGAPLLSAVCVSPSSQQPPGSGAAKIRKTTRLPTRMENYKQQVSKTTCRKSLHLAGTPQLGKCLETASSQKKKKTARKSATSSETKTKRGARSDRRPNRRRGRERRTRRPRTRTHTGEARAATSRGRPSRPANNTTPRPREPKQENTREEAEEQEDGEPREGKPGTKSVPGRIAARPTSMPTSNKHSRLLHSFVASSPFPV